MFKIESYLIPWLVGYLDKYVELKLDDLKLSLWEGDAVLKKLNIRLNVIEELTNFPITFTSGIINELIVHIPWTRITSEPIVITINTIEFVARLKESNKNTNDSNRSRSSSLNKTNEQLIANTDTSNKSDVSFSYIQNLVNKIVNNIQIIVNNVIVKFCEDDIVLSLNIKSAEYFSVDSTWTKSFVDANSIDIRKCVLMSDVTLCLDKCDMSGKVIYYQEPVLYRCSIQVRIHTKLPYLNAKKIESTKISILCSKFNMSITDQQLKIITRLIEIIMPVYYKSTSNINSSTQQNVNKERKISLDMEENELSQSSNDGWISWMWSQVPSISTLIVDENSSDFNEKDLISKFYFGIYFDEFNGCFKLTEMQELFASKKVSFNPFVNAIIKNFSIEVSSWDSLLDVIVGVGNIGVKSVGKCCCGLCLEPSLNEIDLVYSSQNESELKNINYLTNSLFDESQNETLMISSRDKNGNLNVDYGFKRFGTLFFQYLTYKHKISDTENTEIHYNNNNDFNHDILSLVLVGYGLNVNLSTNFLHRLFKFIEYFELDTRCFKNNYNSTEIPFNDLFKYNFILKDLKATIQNPLDHINKEKNSNIQNIITLNLHELNVGIASQHNSKSISKIDNVSSYFNINVNNFEANCSILKNGALIDEIQILEPTYFKFSIQDFDYEPKNKAHLAKEYKFDLQSLTININMQLLFILNYFIETNIIILNKQFLLNQLLYLKKSFNQIHGTIDSMNKNILVLNFVGINLRYSMTTIHQTLQAKCNNFDVKLINTKNKSISCLRNLNNDSVPLVIIQAQAPLNFNSQISEQIFLKFTLGELEINISDELLDAINCSLIKEVHFTKQQYFTQKFENNDYEGVYSETITVKTIDGFFSTYKFAELFYETIKWINIDVKIHSVKIGFISEPSNILFIKIPEIWLRNSMIKFTVNDNRSQKFPFLIFNIATSEHKKLPWEINLSNFQVYTSDFEGLLSKKLLFDIDITCTLAVTPKYDKNNKIQSLSFTFHSDLTKGVELNINQEQLNLILNTSIKLINVIKSFKFKIELPQTKNEITRKNITHKIDNDFDDYAESFSSLTSFNFTNDDRNSTSLSSKSSLPFKVIVHEKAEKRVKISYWVQITAYRILINLHDTKNMISLNVEDVSGFLDIHNVHQKIFYKIGNLFLNHFIYKNDKWVSFDFMNGILVDSSNRINQSLFVFDEKSTQKLSKSSGTGTSSVFSITYTRASYKSFIKKIKEIEKQKPVNNETQSLDYSDIDFYSNKFEKKWISELNISLRCLDLIYHELIFKIISEFSIELVELFTNYILHLTQNAQPSQDCAKKVSSSLLIPLVRPEDVPLINFDIGYCRLILPIIKYNLDIKAQECPILVVQCLKLNASSQVENPLNRNIINSHTIYNKAKSTGALYKPGFPFEDRQYLISLRGLSLFQSTSNDLKEISFNDQENPAAMWNKIDSIKENPIEFKVNIQPIIDYFDLDATVGLPVVYINHEKKIRSILSGYIFEMNILTQNLDFQFTQESISLVLNLIKDNINSINELINKIELKKKDNSPLPSKIETKYSIKIVPIDVLITSEKINFYLNRDRQQSIFYINVFQPHVCLLIYEKMQKLEVTVFDFYIKEDCNNQIYSGYFLESKPGDPNVKTGILPAFFSFKYNNFLSVLLHQTKIKDQIVNKCCINCKKCSSCFNIISYEDEFSSLNKQSNSIITIARPLKFHLRDSALEKVDNFLNEILSTIDILSSNNSKDSKSLTLNQNGFDNLKIVTSQLVFCLEIPESKSQFELSMSNLIFHYFANDPQTIIKNSIHFKTDDGLAYTKLELNEIMCKLDTNSSSYHFFGPVSLNLRLNLFENRYIISTFMDSLNISFSQMIYRNILKLEKSYLYKILLRNEEVIKEVLTSYPPYDVNRFKITEDDLRNGNFGIYNEKNLPDDLNINTSSILPCDNQIYASKNTLCWRYAERRSIVFLKIQPIPFIIQTSSKIKCYLEYLNPCKSSFTQVKEFYLKEESFTTVVDYKDKLNQLKSHLDLTYSTVWRIRLSNDSMSFIHAETLLASTRVDSLALVQDDLSIKNIEIGIKSFEIKLKNQRHDIDMAILNLNNNKVFILSSKENDNLAMFNIRALTNLSISFIETRFLNIIPFVDNVTFKAISNVSIDSNENEIDLSLKANSFNINTSQSTLNASNRVYNEIKEFLNETEISKNELNGYYLILNDTDLSLSIKQYDTEELFNINSGNQLEYNWRTHKKSQLLQIYLPKYKILSKPFSPNHGKIEAVCFKLNEPEKEFNLFIIKEDINEFRKKLTIQGKLMICNFLNFGISVKLALQTTKKSQFQVESNDPIRDLSRSKNTFHIPNDELELQELVIYDGLDHSLLCNLYNIKKSDLIRGILCEHGSINFWLNLHEEDLKEFYDIETSIIQYYLIFTPLMIICSYSPFNLDLSINSNYYEHLKAYKSIQINKIYKKIEEKKPILNIDININDLKRISLKSLSKTVSYKSQKNNDIFLSKRLSESWEVMTSPDEFWSVSESTSLFPQVTVPIVKQATTKVSKEASLTAHQDGSQFTIQKNVCWKFSNTIRIDIKPLCLLVNETRYFIKIQEEFFTKSKENDKQNWKIGSKQKITFTTENDSNRKFKFIIMNDGIQFESGLIKLSDDSSSPFSYLKESSTLYSNNWLDLKLSPILVDSQDELKLSCYLKCIYLTLHSKWSEGDDMTTRIIAIKPKFIIHNLTQYDFKFQLNSFFNDEISIANKEYSKLPSKGMNASGEIFENLTTKTVNPLSISCLKVYQSNKSDFVSSTVQSKPILLCDNELIYRKFNSNTLFINHQYFSIFNVIPQNKIISFLCVQKLCVDEDGRLEIAIKEENHCLIEIFNSLNEPVWIWPRLVDTSIPSFEKFLGEYDLNLANKDSEIHVQSKISSVLALVHYVPPQSRIKVNIELFGTNTYPDNASDLIFLSFGKKLNDNSIKFSKLCKIDHVQFDIDDNISYVSFNEPTNSSIRIIKNKKSLNTELKLPITRPLKLSIDILFENVSLILSDDCLSDDHQTEILRLSGKNIYLELKTNYFSKKEDFMRIALTGQHIQLDNQIYDLTLYDYPVIFIPQAKLQTHFDEIIDYRHFSLEDWIPFNLKNNFLNLRINLNRQALMNEENILLDTAEISIKPFEVYIEDRFITDLIKISINFLNAVFPTQTQETKLELNSANTADPIVFKTLKIDQIEANLNVKTSLKIYLATNKTPIKVKPFIIMNNNYTFYSSEQLVKLATSHYLSSFLYRVGWILGSLDLIGSPASFVTKITNGIYDLVNLPYSGLCQNGLFGLISGVKNGSVSLLLNMSAGTITSLTSFASFVSRNMDLLSFDPDHLARQEELRHQMQQNGPLQITTSFFISLIGAVGGLAEQPLQSIQNSDSLVKGFSKGLIGLVTKPVGAVAELVNQTGDGLLRVTGMKDIPTKEQRLYRPLNLSFNTFEMSAEKFIKKLVPEKTKLNVHAIVEVVFNSSNSNEIIDLKACYLVLIDEVFFVIDKNEDILHRAYFIGEIDIHSSSSVPNTRSSESFKDSVLIVTLFSSKSKPFLEQDDTLNDRLVDFIHYSQEKTLNKSDTYSNQYNFRYNDRPVTNNELKCPCGEVLIEYNTKIDINSNKKKTHRKNQLSESSMSLQLKIHRSQLSDVDTSRLDLSPLNSTKIDNTTQFYFYIDPRVSKNFVCVFQNLKRKYLNKGF